MFLVHSHGNQTMQLNIFLLTCDCDTVYNLQVTWYMDDDEVFPNEKFAIDTDGCTQRLRVRDVRYDDEATYTCKYKHRRYEIKVGLAKHRLLFVENRVFVMITSIEKH